jgi:hypothetical protein
LTFAYCTTHIPRVASRAGVGALGTVACRHSGSTGSTDMIKLFKMDLITQQVEKLPFVTPFSSSRSMDKKQA